MAKSFFKSPTMTFVATLTFVSGLTMSLGARAKTTDSRADAAFSSSSRSGSNWAGRRVGMKRDNNDNVGLQDSSGFGDEGSGGPTIIEVSDDDLYSTASSMWMDGVSLIKKTLKQGDRSELIDVQKKLQDEIASQQKKIDDNDSVPLLQTQQNLYGAVIGNASETLKGVQSALSNAAGDAGVKALVSGKKPGTVEVKNPLPGELFDVKVSYVRDGEGELATLKREVQLVPKKVDDLKQSSNPALSDMAKDPQIQPVLKQAVDAVVDQAAAPLKGYLTENEQKISDIKSDTPPVEKTLASKGSDFKASLEKSEAETNAELDKAVADKEIAKEKNQDNLQRLQGMQALTEWARKNPSEASKLDDCGLSAKALELSPELDFDMLDAKTRGKCKDLVKAEADKNARDLMPDMKTATATPAADNSPVSLAGQNFDRNQLIQQFMQVMQTCMTNNMAAKDSIQKVANLIQPAYEAISGYKDLEESIKANGFVTNVIGAMTTQHIDADMAVLDVMQSAKMLYPNDNDGNTRLHMEMTKIFSLNGKLAGLVDEYQKRTEQMSRAMGDVAAQELQGFIGAANAGDKMAQAELQSRQQQGMPVTAADAYKFAYDNQKKLRETDPSNLQMLRYAQAARASYTSLASLYNNRASQVMAGNNTFVVSGNSVAATAGRAIASSPILGSNPNVSVNAAMSGSYNNFVQGYQNNMQAPMGPGFMRSPGSNAPVMAPGMGRNQFVAPMNRNNGMINNGVMR